MTIFILEQVRKPSSLCMVVGQGEGGHSENGAAKDDEDNNHGHLRHSIDPDQDEDGS
jgi:hypothetical protein